MLCAWCERRPRKSARDPWCRPCRETIERTRRQEMRAPDLCRRAADFAESDWEVWEGRR